MLPYYLSGNRKLKMSTQGTTEDQRIIGQSFRSSLRIFNGVYSGDIRIT